MNRLSRPRLTRTVAASLGVVLTALTGTVVTVPPAAAAEPTPSAPGTGYTLDWENTAVGLPPPNWVAQYNTSKVRMASTANGDPVRAGQRSVRFQLDQSDPALHNGKRAELAATPEEPAGAERWYGFSTYLPSSWVPDSAGDVVTQWHQSDRVSNCGTQGCSPPLSIGTKNGQWVISQSWQNYIGNINDWSFSNTPIGAYQTGRWTDWVVHVKWSAKDSPDATLEIWKDGALVWNKPGLRNDDFPDGTYGNYMKFGIYKWPWMNGPSDTTSRVLYYDELRIADGSGSYAAVSPPRTPGGSAILRPDGDVSREWTGGTTGPAWQAIDDPVTHQTDVTGGDYIWAGGSGRSTTVTLATAPLSGSAAGTKVWFYANTGSSTRLTVQALWGEETHAIDVLPGNGFAWRSFSVNPPNQAAVDNMQLRFTTSGGGDSNVRAAYVELARAA